MNTRASTFSQRGKNTAFSMIYISLFAEHKKNLRINIYIGAFFLFEFLIH